MTQQGRDKDGAQENINMLQLLSLEFSMHNALELVYTNGGT